LGCVSAAVLSFPCFVYRSGELHLRIDRELHVISAAIELHHEAHGGYPSGTGRKLFSDLGSSINPTFRFEPRRYSRERYSAAHVLGALTSSYHGRYELQPFEPIPEGQLFRGPRKTLAAIAALGP